MSSFFPLGERKDFFRSLTLTKDMNTLSIRRWNVLGQAGWIELPNLVFELYKIFPCNMNVGSIEMVVDFRKVKPNSKWGVIPYRVLESGKIEVLIISRQVVADAELAVFISVTEQDIATLKNISITIIFLVL